MPGLLEPGARQLGPVTLGRFPILPMVNVSVTPIVLGLVTLSVSLVLVGRCLFFSSPMRLKVANGGAALVLHCL